MTDVPPGGVPPEQPGYVPPPPPQQPTSPPPPPGGGYAPPAYGEPAYQQQGYGFTQGAEYASFGQRLLAFLIDYVILFVPLLIVYFIAASISDALGVIVYLLGLAAVVWYWATYEGGPEGQTIGKKTMGIRTVDADTLQPGIGAGKAVGRFFARILSGLVCYIGYLWMLWDPEKQTWHDKIVRTKVVKA